MNKRIVASLLIALTAINSIACDTGKGAVAPVVVTVNKQQVDVPFNYSDCATPATVSFTVVIQKKSKEFSVRVRDVATGVETILDPYRPVSTTFAFPPLPAAGHVYVVELFNGAHATKVVAEVYAQ